jgi:hypothetical protein
VILPRGVTGFAHTGQKNTTVDFSTFRGHCYEIARQLPGSVLSTHPHGEAGTCNSFAAAVISCRGQTVLILLNAYLPLLGFARPPVRYMSQEFVDPRAKMAKGFRDFGYQVLDKAILDAPLTQESLAELRKSELKQVRYWETRRVGDVIFNHWD